jgi:hypothetical protein
LSLFTYKILPFVATVYVASPNVNKAVRYPAGRDIVYKLIGAQWQSPKENNPMPEREVVELMMG